MRSYLHPQELEATKLGPPTPNTQLNFLQKALISEAFNSHRIKLSSKLHPGHSSGVYGINLFDSSLPYWDRFGS
jgi:hypothetical protein